MKRAITFLFMIFLFTGIFAQDNGEYQSQLAKAKEFESQKKWVAALASYYDAMAAEPSEKAEEAYNLYSKLADT